MTSENGSTNLPATMEIGNILEEARKDAGFERRMTFNKGEFLVDGKSVKVGTRMVANPILWQKKWVKFVNKAVVESRIYNPAKKEKAPDRSEMPDLEEDQWPREGGRPSGKPLDPWVLYYLMPMLNLDTDEALKFSTYSKGGYRAIGDLVTAYGQRAHRDQKCGLPIIKLEIKLMPTSSWGKVQRPDFPIVDWSDGTYQVRETAEVEILPKDDFSDEIPF